MNKSSTRLELHYFLFQEQDIVYLKNNFLNRMEWHLDIKQHENKLPLLNMNRSEYLELQLDFW